MDEKKSNRKSSLTHGGSRSGAGRKPGTPNKANMEMRLETKEFFSQLLDDETEARFWRYFMTGYVVDQLPDGTTQLVTIPLNPIALNAFKRAVEYKRGLPVQTVAVEEKREPLPLGMDFVNAENASRVC